MFLCGGFEGVTDGSGADEGAEAGTGAGEGAGAEAGTGAGEGVGGQYSSLMEGGAEGTGIDSAGTIAGLGVGTGACLGTLTARAAF